MKYLFLTICVQLIGFSNLLAQSKLNNYLYTSNKESYILSEKIKLNGSTDQTFNSLFIWKKDKVVRIIFKYIKRIPDDREINVRQLQSLSNFFPPFEKYTLYERLSGHQSSNYVYSGKIKYNNISEYNRENYTIALKTTINNWNKQHNPLADRLGGIVVSDGNPDVLFKNPKRKEEYTNNLPLIVRSPGNDSLYIIKPYLINIYRLDNSKEESHRSNYGLIRYELYSTISLIEDSFSDKYIKDVHNFMEDFIARRTLRYLYRANFPPDSSSLLEFLSHYPSSNQKFNSKENAVDAVVVDPVEIKNVNQTPQAIAIAKKNKMLEDSIQAHADSLRKVWEADCYGHYQYCQECYNNSISKKMRIQMHCPIKVASYSSDYDENWSYAFYNKDIPYFEVETGYRTADSFMDEYRITDYNYSIVWQMMTPGIGYWMSNVAGNYRHYKMNSNGLLLNGVGINQ